MKQHIIGGVIGATITAALLVGSAQAGLFNSITTSGWDDKDVTSRYTLDVKGFDVRVYEWTPTANPNVRMVFVAGETSSGVGSYVVAPDVD